MGVAVASVVEGITDFLLNWATIDVVSDVLKDFTLPFFLRDSSMTLADVDGGEAQYAPSLHSPFFDAAANFIRMHDWVILANTPRSATDSSSPDLVAMDIPSTVNSDVIAEEVSSDDTTKTLSYDMSSSLPSAVNTFLTTGPDLLTSADISLSYGTNGATTYSNAFRTPALMLGAQSFEVECESRLAGAVGGFTALGISVESGSPAARYSGGLPERRVLDSIVHDVVGNANDTALALLMTDVAQITSTTQFHDAEIDSGDDAVSLNGVHVVASASTLIEPTNVSQLEISAGPLESEFNGSASESPNGAMYVGELAESEALHESLPSLPLESQESINGHSKRSIMALEEFQAQDDVLNGYSIANEQEHLSHEELINGVTGESSVQEASSPFRPDESINDIVGTKDLYAGEAILLPLKRHLDDENNEYNPNKLR